MRFSVRLSQFVLLSCRSIGYGTGGDEMAEPSAAAFDRPSRGESFLRTEGYCVSDATRPEHQPPGVCSCLFAVLPILWLG